MLRDFSKRKGTNFPLILSTFTLTWFSFFNLAHTTYILYICIYTKLVHVQKSCTVHIFPRFLHTYQQIIQVLPILHHLCIQTKPCHWNTSASQQARMVAPCKSASNCLFFAIFRGCFLAQIFTDSSWKHIYMMYVGTASSTNSEGYWAASKTINPPNWPESTRTCAFFQIVGVHILLWKRCPKMAEQN